MSQMLSNNSHNHAKCSRQKFSQWFLDIINVQLQIENGHQFLHMKHEIKVELLLVI